MKTPIFSPYYDVNLLLFNAVHNKDISGTVAMLYNYLYVPVVLF